MSYSDDTLHRLHAYASETYCEYVEVIFPMLYDPDKPGHIGFCKADGSDNVWFNKFTDDGLTYVLYRLGSYVDRDNARELFSNNRRAFVEYINQCRHLQETEHWKEHNKPLIIAHQDGWVWGMLTHYNPISNRSVIERVQKSNLRTRLTGYNFTSVKELRLYFRSRYVVDDTFSFGLSIVNGETGHLTLGYDLYVKSSDYIFFFPMKLAKRHLSKVGEVNDKLEDILETAGRIEIDTILLNTKVRELPLSDKRFDKIRVKIDTRQEQTANKLISVLLEQRTNYGYKTVCNAALDTIFSYAFNQL